MQISENLLKIYNNSKATQSFEDFISSIENIILENTPKILHARIKNKIQNLNFEKQELSKSSEFEESKNTVFISSMHICDKNVYLHEIMHAIGCEMFFDETIIGLASKKYFSVGDYIISSNLGHGINEGLNQHYTEKFISKYATISEVSPEYSFCANIASSLEKLLGENNCKYVHLSGIGIGNLIRLAVNKCHLPSENKILKLILQLDTYKTISRQYVCFGMPYTSDTKVILIDTYKTLITLALMKAKGENKDLLYSEVISSEHLVGDNLAYFNKYMQKELIGYFYKEKEHIFNDTLKKFKGIDKAKLEQTTKQVFTDYITQNIVNKQSIPNDLKCGEFYNHIFLSCMINNQQLSSRLIYTSDFFAKLTESLFCEEYELVPSYHKELVQLVTHILASRNIVRSGVEISDAHIISACKNENFNYYFMDIAPDTYRQIFSQIDDSIKQNPKVVEAMLKRVFNSRVNLYKFEKQMHNILENNPEIKNLYEKAKTSLESKQALTKNLDNF